MAYEGKKSNKEYVCIEGIKLQLPCQSGTEKIETLPYGKVSTEDLWDPIPYNIINYFLTIINMKV